MELTSTLRTFIPGETPEEVNTTGSTLQQPEATMSPDNGTLCLPKNASVAFAPDGGDLKDLCQPAEFMSGFYSFRLICNCILGAICIVSFILCAVFLRALRNAKGKVSSRWCIASVIVMDIALGVMQAYGAVVYIIRHSFGLYTPTLECSVSVSHILMNFWTGLPALLSLLTLALDQLIAIAFPMETHVKSRGRLKKTVFSLVIWGPSTLFCAAFAGLWLASEDRTCFRLHMILMSAASSFGTAGIICLSVNVVVYGALFVKVVLFKYFNSLRKSNQDEAQNKLRSVFLVFSAIFVANSIFWLPPWMYLALANVCAPDDMACFDRFRDNYLILMIFYQLNTIFDPLFLAWRFPVIRSQMFLACRGEKEQRVETSQINTRTSQVN